MQLNLGFSDLPNEDSLWEQLDANARAVAIETLAQAIAKVVTESHLSRGEDHNE